MWTVRQTVFSQQILKWSLFVLINYLQTTLVKSVNTAIAFSTMTHHHEKEIIKLQWEKSDHEKTSFWQVYGVILVTTWILPLAFLRETYPYSELFWSIFSRIRTEYGEIRTLFTQCFLHRSEIMIIVCLDQIYLLQVFHISYYLHQYCLLLL